MVLSLGSTTAYAVSLSPMILQSKSYTDQVVFRVFPKNPYNHRINMEVRVYDQKFRLIRARVSPRRMKLGAGLSRPVTVTVPFEGKKTRKIRICAESIPFPSGKAASVRTRVCVSIPA